LHLFDFIYIFSGFLVLKALQFAAVSLLLGSSFPERYDEDTTAIGHHVVNHGPELG